MTLPILFLLLDVYPLRRFGTRPRVGGEPSIGSRRIWLEKAPFLVLSIAAGVLSAHAKANAQSIFDVTRLGVAARLAQSAYGTVFYGWKSLFPVDLSPIYEIRLPIQPAAPRYIVCILVLAVVAAGLALFARRRRGVWVALASYVVLLLPVLGLVQAGNQEAADRYSYLPAIPLSILVAAGLQSLFDRLPKPGRVALGAALIAALAVLGTLTWRQIAVWRSSATLWAHAVRVAPNSSIAQNGFGFILLESKRYDEALLHLNRAVAIQPANEMTHKNLWRLWREQGRADQLTAALRESIRVWPTFVDAHFLLAAQLSQAGDQAGAKSEYLRALELRPDHSGALTNLGHILAREGRIPEALARYEAATRADPSNAIAWRSWAVLLHEQGHRDEALDKLRQTFRLDPNDPRARAYWKDWTGSPPP
jgi:tetratricopeptide (TPR) repeat protein